MKKIISLLLTFLMLSSLALPAFAETDSNTNEPYEEFDLNFGYSGYNGKVETENFILEATWHNRNSVSCGSGESFKISAKPDSGLIIKRVEVRLSNYGGFFGEVCVSAGEKREKGGVNSGCIAHVDNIGGSEVSFTEGQALVSFDMIRVYYYEETHEHIWGENEKCEICGALKCEITGEHTAVCIYCGKELLSSEIGFVGSAISGGNIAIITAIAGIIIGMTVMYFIMKNKKAIPLNNIEKEIKDKE